MTIIAWYGCCLSEIIVIEVLNVRMRIMKKILLLFIILMVMTLQAKAGVVGYKGNKAGFDAAILGLSGVSINVLDFESVAAGSVVPENSTLGGLTFNSNLPNPFQMGVHGNSGTSGLNTLAETKNGGSSFALFGLSDVVDVSFAPSHAFGFYLVIPEGSDSDFFTNDVIVTFGGATIAIDGTDVAEDFGVNSFDALWLGLVDDMATHTSAKIRFGTPGVEFEGIGEFDDFTITSATTSSTPASEPAAILLFGIGLLGLLSFTRRRY